MPWYKLELKGGKGHTNHEIKYVWSDLKWNKAEKEDRWDSWTREFGYERMWDGYVTYVKHLPAKVKDQKIAAYNKHIEDDKKMIKLLS